MQRRKAKSKRASQGPGAGRYVTAAPYNVRHIFAQNSSLPRASRVEQVRRGRCCMDRKKPRLDLGGTGFSDGPPAGGAAPSMAQQGAAFGGAVNPLTGRPYSDRYRGILAKRVQLPVYLQRDDFVQMLRTHQTIVLVGETGSGKTTQARDAHPAAAGRCG